MLTSESSLWCLKKFLAMETGVDRSF